MKKYMLFLIQDLKEVERMTSEELKKDIEEHTKWVNGLIKSGNYQAGEPLLNEARVVTPFSIETDGPYIEAKEAITGYFIISASDIDEASRIAQTCPSVRTGGKMLVRPVMDYK